MAREHPPLPRADGDRADLELAADGALAHALATARPETRVISYQCDGCGRSWTARPLTRYWSAHCHKCGTWVTPRESETDTTPAGVVPVETPGTDAWNRTPGRAAPANRTIEVRFE